MIASLEVGEKKACSSLQLEKRRQAYALFISNKCPFYLVTV
ncbi:hypothetical protein VCHA50P415_10097 [Vibrio chagasii]|nr:hypothetical protein VCHA35P150_10007 [Vibrio chagasii]CAH6847662.1 hypothetical protein VCHA34O109_10007 [Vibrio chagasii]CAH6963967.1 hypothetical protein VCHA50P415_10097 [Vibrio chagasii]CAH7020140.1 hypothetical protein VCHA43P275_10007 [Vibrio chagasii]CAH7038353.1 hypothetical protein VCHA40P240_180093 [Vibrio chagasii]